MESLTFDLSEGGVRPLNQHLHRPASELNGQHIAVVNPDGAHNIAVGINAAVKVTIDGHAGYYAAGMNKGDVVLSVDGKPVAEAAPSLPVRSDTRVTVRVNSWIELRAPNGDVLAQSFVRAGESYVVPAGIAYRITDAR